MRGQGGYANIKALTAKIKRSMLKTKLIVKRFNQINPRLITVAIAGCLLLVFAIRAGINSPSVKADATCSTIADCQQQIANNNNAVTQLQAQATSYQDAINHLNAQIDQLQSVIDTNVAEQANLQQQINAAQAQLDQQKKTLGEDIRAMYLESQTSTLEILASSKDISDFVNKETYRNSVQSKIKTTVDKIAALKAQLEAQQRQLAALINDEQTQRSQLATAQAQQQQMLNYNESQQASYNAQTAQNQQKLNALIAAQRRANSSVSSGGYYFIHFPGTISNDPINGSYPYADWPFSMSLAPGCVDGDGPDQWGYCTRQCVSYAAWAVAYSGRSAPLYWGNASEWVAQARAAGIPFDSYPQPGDVAISTAGTWGHAMYVEQISGRNMFVSEYNNFLTGQYYTEWRNF